jgi:putative flippase GtrA
LPARTSVPDCSPVSDDIAVLIPCNDEELTIPNMVVSRQPAFFGKSFFQFAAIGALAMFVDMGVLWLVTTFGHTGPYAGRVYSFLCGATTTWILNRSITFRDRRTKNIVLEYLRFLAVCTGGGTINFAVYSLIVYLTPKLVSLPSDISALVPFAGVACGSASGLLVNYAGSWIAVFTGGKSAD